MWTLSKQEKPQPSETASTVSYPSQDPSVVGELSCISSGDPWIIGVRINSMSSVRRQAGAECHGGQNDFICNRTNKKLPGRKSCSGLVTGKLFVGLVISKKTGQVKQEKKKKRASHHRIFFLLFQVCSCS